MHEDRLRQLNELLPLIEANAQECRAIADDAEEIVRFTKAVIAEETREHHHLRGLALIPAALGGGGLALKAWGVRHSRDISSAAGGVVTGAAATVFAVAALTGPAGGGGDGRDGPPSLAEPAPPLPPYGHNPPRVGPPKGTAAPSWSPPAQPDGGLPVPLPAASIQLPRPSPTLPTLPPVPPVVPPPVQDPSAGEPDGDEATPAPRCSLDLRKILLHSLLCGH